MARPSDAEGARREDCLKLVSWNVNSIRVREERLLRLLERLSPDALCLQELKVPDDKFPFEALREAGYHAAVHGQKTYNGVAILSKVEAEGVERGFGDDEDDAQARLIAGRIDGVHVVCVYVPNGGEVGSDKWTYKLRWMKRLRGWLDRRFASTDSVALCGDFNVAPEDRDVHDPPAWEGSVLSHPDVRGALGEVRDFGLVDSFRLHHEEPGFFSWWDYRMLGFPKNRGLRIDHIDLSAPLAERCTAASIERDERKGKQPSDHAPVIAELDV
jgi:exodeoxyribonuclease-3